MLAGSAKARIFKFWRGGWGRYRYIEFKYKGVLLITNLMCKVFPFLLLLVLFFFFYFFYLFIFFIFFLCHSFVTRPLNTNVRELKHATFLSHGRTPEAYCFPILPVLTLPHLYF